MKALLVVMVAAIVALTLPSFASDTNSLTASEIVLKGALDKLLTELSRSEPDDALKALFDKYWMDHESAATKAEALGARFKADEIRNRSSSGKAVRNGYEFLGVRRLGGNSIRMVYLQKFERSELPWTFVFYKTTDDYKMSGFSYGKGEASDDANTFAVSVPAGR